MGDHLPHVVRRRRGRACRSRRQKTRYDAGMTGFTYPKEYGGHGADAWQEAIYEEEAAGYEASSGFIRSTIMMLGPTLMASAPRSRSGDLIPPAWVTTPGVSSSASPAQVPISPVCRVAERDGDEFVVNGQKVELGQAVVRPRHAAGPHQPRPAEAPRHHVPARRGWTTPASRCARSSRPPAPVHFNEVFFDNVRAPVANVRRHRQRLARRPHGDGQRVGDDRWRWRRQHLRPPAVAR